MISYSLEPGSDSVRATFSLEGGDLYGRPISVVGDFNNWDPAAAPLLDTDGLLSASFLLEPGRRYRFHYVTTDGDAVHGLPSDEVEIHEGHRRPAGDPSS